MSDLQTSKKCVVIDLRCSYSCLAKNSSESFFRSDRNSYEKGKFLI